MSVPGEGFWTGWVAGDRFCVGVGCESVRVEDGVDVLLGGVFTDVGFLVATEPVV